MKKVFLSIIAVLAMSTGVNAADFDNGKEVTYMNDPNNLDIHLFKSLFSPCNTTIWICEPGSYDTSHAIKTVTITVNADSESDCFDFGTKVYLAYASAYPEYDVISSTSGGGK